MASVDINITGGTYKNKSLPLTAQVCRNFHPRKISDTKAVSKYVLEPYHGLKLFAQAPVDAKNRGMYEHTGFLYKVTGTTLYKIDSSGNHTNVGNIYGSERCIFAPVGNYLCISSGGNRYLYDGTTTTLITDPDLEKGNSVTSLNNRAIYDGQDGRFWVSDVSLPASINALNYGTAESNADGLIRVFAFGQALYLMGQKTIEPYYDSGEGNPPMVRYEGAIIEVGLGALHSVANDDTSVFFLGDDKQVYVIRNGISGAVTKISTDALSEEFAKYDDISDASGYMIQLEGEWQYHLTFPLQNKTWVFPLGGEWFELSSGDAGGRYIGDSYSYCFNKHLIADYRNGNIYELDRDTYTENGETVIRTRVTPPIHGGLFKKSGKTLYLNRFELIMETGVGLPSGQGYDPQVILSFSDDGGKTWSKERYGKIGKLGEFGKSVYWTALGSFKSRIVKIQMSDPVYTSIYYANIDVEVGI